MKKLILIISLFISSGFFAQTQTVMNINSYNEYLKTDKELNKVYQQILKEYISDKLFLQKLKVSQNYWVKFRDAETEARFPEEDKKFNYGSIYPVCVNAFMAEKTKARIKELKVWLDGNEEGEMCNGSVK